ncbi:MAG TPA: hypothetical protein VI895_06575 [Bdellovibrionota bacterium]|nr:hypothetical protein [Bdellovibrionota bacterium]
MRHPHRKSGGNALTIALISLLVLTLIIAGFLLRSNTGLQRARFGRDTKISFNRAEVGLKYCEDTIRKYTSDGLKLTFETLNPDGGTNTTELNEAKRIFEGGVAGDPDGLTLNDSIDFLSLYNNYYYYDPLLQVPVPPAAWFKVMGSQRSQDYIYYSYQTTAHPRAERFAMTTLIAPDQKVCQQNDVITVSYRYAGSAIGAGHLGEWPAPPPAESVLTRLDPQATQICDVSIDLAPFQATNYNGSLACFDDKTFSRIYSEEEGFLVMRGNFSIRIFPPDQIVSDFLPQYPPRGSPYGYRPEAQGIAFDPGPPKRFVIATNNGLELIDAATGANSTILIPGEANKFEEGVTFCDNYKSVCLPNRDGDLIVANVDPVSSGFLSYRTIAGGSYPGNTFIASKGNFVAYTGPNGVGLLNAATNTMAGGINLGNCSAVTTSPNTSDPLFYVGCGNSLFSINPNTMTSTLIVNLPMNTQSAVMGANQRLYVTDATGTTLTTVDVATSAVISSIPLPFQAGDLSNGLSTDGKSLRCLGLLANGSGSGDDEYFIYTFDVSQSTPALTDVMAGPVDDPTDAFIGPDGSILVTNYQTPGKVSTATRFLPAPGQFGQLCDATLKKRTGGTPP